MALSSEDLRSREAEAVILVKAAPQAGQKHGEVVCCAGMDNDGNWLRLYPVSFKTLEESQKFKRWDRIQFKWRLPNDDSRVESRRVDQHTIEIIGSLLKRERSAFLSRSIVTSLEREREAGRSFALLQSEILDFSAEKKSSEELSEERTRFDNMRIQAAQDLFNTEKIIPHVPCPFKFKYKYRTEDGLREGTCQDWEIEATYFKWSRRYGEQQAIERMIQRFGEEYPEKGMLLAMGTHRHWKDRWLINGVIRYHPIKQLSFL